MTNEERYKEALKRIWALSRNNAIKCFGIADEALNPKPQYEDVEVVAWQCPTCDRLYSDEFIDRKFPSVCCNVANSHKTLIKLTGTYRREIKPKIKHRLCAGKNSRDPENTIALNAPPYADIYVEWEE